MLTGIMFSTRAATRNEKALLAAVMELAAEIDVLRSRLYEIESSRFLCELRDKETPHQTT